VLFETYVHTMGIEARTMLQMAETMVLPAATRYQIDLANAISATEAVGVECPATGGRLHDLVRHVTGLEDAIGQIADAMKHHGATCDVEARSVQDRLIPALENARTHCDAIEQCVPADLWPMPTYTDLLFSGE
ncbi:MAG: glutamine synthetase type III, partial [Phycisphaerae bacterium]|nr:glutamine synthetase type III [Phycisphaerae bacterium]